jgi:hypothetical protein
MLDTIATACAAAAFLNAWICEEHAVKLGSPSGYIRENDEPECDSCNRKIRAGRPFWGGGLDYFGEAESLHCERCERAYLKEAERQVCEYERSISVRK